LKAYTSPQNKGMIRLFHTLDYQVQTQYEDEFLVLKCTF
jgi:hypothetical protein